MVCYEGFKLYTCSHLSPTVRIGGGSQHGSGHNSVGRALPFNELLSTSSLPSLPLILRPHTRKYIFSTRNLERKGDSKRGLGTGLADACSDM